MTKYLKALDRCLSIFRQMIVTFKQSLPSLSTQLELNLLSAGQSNCNTYCQYKSYIVSIMFKFKKPWLADNLRKYQSHCQTEIKSKIHSFNCLSSFYSCLELQGDFIFWNLFFLIYCKYI